jgi:hypothetical protein
MTRTIFIAAALALAATLPIAPAQAAGVARTFLSAAGSDSNNCANVLTPCRHLATAYAATAANGEIYVLDPANYGSLTITGPVSIEGHGWASIAPASGQAAITINAPGATDKINIIGVVLDGTAITNTTGIQFNSGGSLTVRDSVIRNFSNNGINFVPNSSTLSQLFVSSTLISDNGSHGINIDPAGSGIMASTFDHVQMENNAANGLRAHSATQTVTLGVSDSVSANNGADGIESSSLNSGFVFVAVRSCTIANNGANGLAATGAQGQLFVSRSMIMGNNIATSTSGGGLLLSYDDNNLVTNFTDTTPSTIIYK